MLQKNCLPRTGAYKSKSVSFYPKAAEWCSGDTLHKDKKCYAFISLRTGQKNKSTLSIFLPEAVLYFQKPQQLSSILLLFLCAEGSFFRRFRTPRIWYALRSTLLGLFHVQASMYSFFLSSKVSCSLSIFFSLALVFIFVHVWPYLEFIYIINQFA